ncbi:MAG: flavodoxin domain-containing protein [Planctomycetota bacterium]
MTTDLIPSDAPFEKDQRRFAEGFLAGLLSVRAAHEANKPVDDSAGTPLTIAYGSQSGNCEALSKDLRKLARSKGFKPNVVELNAITPEALQETRHLLVVCSTFGEGDPPDNAAAFCKMLQADEAPALPDMHYAVCAMGDRSYTHFCKTGIDIDRRIGSLGATRMVDRVDCDVAFEDDWAQWKQGVFACEEMAEVAGEVPAGLTEIEDEDQTAAGWDKNNPYFAPVLEVSLLNGEGSAKEVNHVEILLSGSGLEYEVGDALGLWPTNHPGLVEETLALTGITGTDRVMIKGELFPIRLALQTKLDIVTLTHNTLESLDINGAIDEVAGLHLLDALRKWEPNISAQRLADALRPLQPRLYSIASSPKAHPGEVHLTVGAVRYELDETPRHGVASTYLADRCGFGERVGVYVHKSPHFHLTPNDQAPIIMCGPGTGIAPFRAFLEERQARKAEGIEIGESWLFFGDQHEETDFLYREELAAMQADQTLTKLSLAWSRDGQEKVYVQDRMRQQSEELFRWLDRGAHFYICGDASRMAGDVDKALREIVAEHGGMDPAKASEFVDTLAREGRYQRDVY